MRVQTGDNVGIGGFIITGSTPKHVIIRGIGPTLTQYNIVNVLADPVLELHGPGDFVTMLNNNWRDTQESRDPGHGHPADRTISNRPSSPPCPRARIPRSSKAMVTLPVSPSWKSMTSIRRLTRKLANISTRAFVSTGDDIVIAGFLVSDDMRHRTESSCAASAPASRRVGLPNALANPTLELHDHNGTLLAANNDWQDDPAQAAEITAAGLAPTNNLESAIAATLPPGLYTALLAG